MKCPEICEGGMKMVKSMNKKEMIDLEDGLNSLEMMGVVSINRKRLNQFKRVFVK
jgi:hypothetical protein